MSARGLSTSRPTTPESPSTSSLHRAMTTVDDLTQALSNFSQVTAPDPVTNLTCCCGLKDCENSQVWLEHKSQLESRLTLSAEVGQALLQRHEAYIRQHENHVSDSEDDEDETIVFKQEKYDAQYAALFKEKQTLEKRLNQAIVNNEVTEVSNKTLLQELNDARATISRLTAHHARSIGWDTRLTAALRERDDMQQERDSESHRARLAESRFEALKDKTVKLQAEARRLQDSAEEKRSHRLESSLSLLQDVRTRIESIREAKQGHAHTMDGYEEITKILESLVQDNETLKHDNDELQQLLSHSREDFASLQEEYEEYKANPVITRSGVPEPSAPLSPPDSLSPHDWRWTHKKAASLKSPSPISPSRPSLEIENDQDNGNVATERRRSPRPLLLLSKSRGVQTESGSQSPLPPLASSPMPSLMPSLSPYERSETSSFSESSSAQMTSLIERISTLLARMLQTDPLSLTNRLKRQHLQGADIRHLSKSTISHIVSDVNSLRQQYRSLLEEEKAALLVTRKDLRGLFKFFRDVFTELAQIRGVLNEVILDPTMASKVSQRALYPEDIDAPANPGAQSWITPISKFLFFPPRAVTPPPLLTSSSSARSRNPRFVPKSGPALAASATTVNVEFSGVGGKSTTNTIAAPVAVARTPPAEGTTTLMDIFAGAPQISASTSTGTDNWVVVSPQEQTRPMASLMQLGQEFEGHSPSLEAEGSRTIGRNTTLPMPQAGITRAVDAVIDESQNHGAPLLQRTLRRRGLSDSSIHTTFATHGDQPQESPRAGRRQAQPHRALADVFRTAWPDSSSVFQALSRTVQNLKLSGSAGSGPQSTMETTPILPVPSEQAATEDATKLQSQSQLPDRPRTPNSSKHSSSTSTTLGRITSSPTKLPPVTSSKLPKERRAVTINHRKGARTDFMSWAPTTFMLDSATSASDPFAVRNVVGSFREESFMHRTPRNGTEI
ncbi:hypothetical protein AGABI2DRAFT_188669 [Agaricus bisporus var. bisporus H97]|uniref:hypothetical protein n=1 Tax=Agaricus bisporus var. bisporus (strain H97 / ATCC MYA-4626 / FGSC 10389) TaxID=936046 RepID=UPI00029F66D8|nr:hypothetical protein AGABI2DRAFT_188669 [Agaricus bisporus var. bisporus H97]EKV42536.1 hypothetical protein AGABI2DRAFT_188669 [Agaricus bisporus var. bisporus H97]